MGVRRAVILGGSCVLQCFCTERLIWKRQRSNSFRPTSQRYETVAYLPPVEGSTVGIPGMFQDGEKKVPPEAFLLRGYTSAMSTRGPVLTSASGNSPQNTSSEDQSAADRRFAFPQ